MQNALAQRKQLTYDELTNFTAKSEISEMEEDAIHVAASTVDISDLPELSNHTATNHDSEDSDNGQFISFLDRKKDEMRNTKNNIRDLHKRRPSIKELKGKGVLQEDAYADVPKEVQEMVWNTCSNMLQFW